MSYMFADSLQAGSGQNSVPSWSCSQAVSKPVWHTPLLCVQWKTDDGQRNCLKQVEFYSKNKIAKLVNSWFYYKNLSRCTPECQIGFILSLSLHYHGFVLNYTQAQLSCILVYYHFNPKDNLNKKFSSTSLNNQFMSITKTEPWTLFIAIIKANKQTNKQTNKLCEKNAGGMYRHQYDMKVLKHFLSYMCSTLHCQQKIMWLIHWEGSKRRWLWSMFKHSSCIFFVIWQSSSVSVYNTYNSMCL